jgi:hypothetical protein
MALCDKHIKPKWDTGSIYFKYSTEDIFRAIKEVAYRYKVYEEDTFMAIYTNNLIWVTQGEVPARAKFVPLNFPGMESIEKRVKRLNITYNFWEEILGEAYKTAIKPIKVPHIHFTIDRALDSFMYGINNQKKVLMPERLIKIFNKHGVKGIFPKKMKNLMVYLNPEKKFQGETENLFKKQIDNSLKMGWKKEDIVLVTNFPYKYRSVEAMVIDNKDQVSVAGTVFHLLNEGVVKEAELWWYHDLDVFQSHPMESSQIDLEDTTAGIINTGNFFFRKDSDKLFEWIRNKAKGLKADESKALEWLAAINYRNINSLYKNIKPEKPI